MARLRRRMARRRKRERMKDAALLAALLASIAVFPKAALAIGTVLPATRQPSERSQNFAIPAEPLDRAIADFSKQSGITVDFSPADVRGRRASAVHGTFAPADALRTLIGDAPFVIHVIGPDTMALDEASKLRTIGSVAVANSPYGASRPGIGKYTQPLLDTPQTIVEVPQQVIRDQNSTTLRDVLRNVSGISLAAGEGASQGDSLTIRGFDAKDDFYLDGMRDFGNYYRDPFNLERLEVIMGPASMLLGHGEGGGIVNQVSKVPALTTFQNFSLTSGTDSLQRFTLDTNQQVGPNAAFRINGMAESTDTAGRNVTTARRAGLAPSLSLGLDTADRFRFSFYGQTDNAIPDYGIPYINDRPAQVPRSNFYGFANGDRLLDDIMIGTIVFEHDFSSTVTLHNQLRYASYEHSFGASDALTPSPQPSPGTPPANITVARTQHSRNGDETFLQEQSYLTGHFGPNTALFGYEVTRETSHEIINTVTGLPSTNLLNPNPYQPFTFTSITPRTEARTTADTMGVFAADSLALGRHFELDGGLRLDVFAARENELVSGSTAVQDVRKLSPQAAIVYKPIPEGSIYLSYDTSFQPSADALSLTTAQIVAPASNTTFELGSKWNVHPALSVMGSVFNSVMHDAHITEPDGTVLPVGTEQSNGLQTQIQGNLSPRWLVNGGYTLLETKVLSYTLPTQPAVVGTRIPNAPTGSANLWTTYRLPRMELGAGVFGLSQRQASIGVDTATGQPILVPGYMRLDMMAKYRLSPVIALQINAYNVLDKYYLDEIHPDHVVPGAARTVEFNLTSNTVR